MFNYFLFKLQESGPAYRMWSLWKTTPRKDCFDIGTRGLGMFNMLAAFCVPGAAVLLSLLILGCERIFMKASQSNMKKPDVSHPVLNISEVRKDTSI